MDCDQFVYQKDQDTTRLSQALNGRIDSVSQIDLYIHNLRNPIYDGIGEYMRHIEIYFIGDITSQPNNVCVYFNELSPLNHYLVVNDYLIANGFQSSSIRTINTTLITYKRPRVR